MAWEGDFIPISCFAREETDHRKAGRREDFQPRCQRYFSCRLSSAAFPGQGSSNVTHGEMTSTSAKPLCRMPAFKIGMSCCLSPEKLRATNVAPMLSASMTGSIGGWVFGSPRFDFDPMSVDAENCPFVRP